MKTEFESKHRFDQCGIVMYLDSDNRLKGSIEYENERFQHLGSVVTNNGYSDWATTEIDANVKRESALDFFKKTKYEKTVIDPLTGEPENLIEVINQCQTYLVSLMVAKHLLAKFPDIEIVHFQDVK